MKNRILLIALLFLNLLFINNTYATKFAVIVGIRDYKDGKDLEYADKDADDIEEVLINVGGWDSQYIEKLKDSDATYSHINDAVVNMKTHATSSDICLFFFSGHGEEGFIESYEGSHLTAYYLDNLFSGFNTSKLYEA
ncbi:MAG: caspase family protein [Promethearchaeota archaeon]